MKYKQLEYYEDCHGCFIVTSHKAKSDGYPQFCRDGKRWRIHRWMYEKHIGIIPKGMLVCHTCDNRKCINPAHLFLGTHKDNLQDSSIKGRIARGEDQGLSKLNKKQVIEIRNSKEGLKRLAEKYNISTHTAWSVRTKRTWAWLV